MTKLDEKLARLPDRPGVYLYRDAKAQVIYVGKAASLRSRVRSYFQESRPHDAKTDSMVRQIADLEYIVTDNELEALMLEANLVRKHRPRYNIILRDDKHYPFLKLTTDDLSFIGTDLEPKLEPGTFEIFVGPSAKKEDLLQTTIRLLAS